MQKRLLFLGLLLVNLPVLAQDEIPTALTSYYQPSLDELQSRIWLRKDQPDLQYSACLDKQVSTEQRIVVMCGYLTGASEPDTAPFDIWYLNGDAITARITMEGYGRMGTSGGAKAVKIGDRWGVVLKSSYMMQGFEQTFQQFYVAQGKNIQLIASLPTYSSSEDFGAEKEGYSIDKLDTQVAFAQKYTGTYPNMLLHATGVLEGEKIDKQWSVPFDSKTNKYLIPEEIDIGY
ncbi:hypothetical protein EER74_10610 [Salmonella enterica subsp. enterica]|uniref:Uncharacterized protein n=1 Tax=Salmonella enterica subsp. enterica serovar Crewe TaxID=2572727 RepID=A0A657HZZ8_SALET|nr:hypothetical protein [Salmonella enterica subsp. enterica serovar Bron]EFP1336786.1 hypothetical protein [Salmonella enterica]EHN2901331.1 hypothetical protein [Salmonella enterica]MMC65403.1 hypothetical protein [Salmonella enterica subsp. enterica serovar Crewe]HBJ6459265.1 hypothetical protein [Salmonella enterica subsp. enterica serovar Nyanza]